MVILEAVDVECPFCRDYSDGLNRVRTEFGGAVTVGYVHLPLAQHRFSMLGSRALECAHQEQRFAQLLSGLLSRQDSIGLRPWRAYALDAGVRDVDGFELCIGRTEELESVNRGIDLNKRAGAKGTPTVYINGYIFSAPPSSERLANIVRRIAAGEDARAAIESEGLLSVSGEKE